MCSSWSSSLEDLSTGRARPRLTGVESDSITAAQCLPYTNGGTGPEDQGTGLTRGHSVGLCLLAQGSFLQTWVLLLSPCTHWGTTPTLPGTAGRPCP